MSPAVYTADEAAAILGGSVKASWLKEMARKREIPFTMLGGYRWTDAHLEEIIALREHRPAPVQPAPAATPRASGRTSAAPAGSAPVPLLRPRQPRRRAAA
jgi:hypothetical protein